MTARYPAKIERDTDPGECKTVDVGAVVRARSNSNVSRSIKIENIAGDGPVAVVVTEL